MTGGPTAPEHLEASAVRLRSRGRTGIPASHYPLCKVCVNAASPRCRPGTGRYRVPPMTLFEELVVLLRELDNGERWMITRQDMARSIMEAALEEAAAFIEEDPSMSEPFRIGTVGGTVQKDARNPHGNYEYASG